MKSISRLGEVKQIKAGLTCEIVEYKNYNDISVKFVEWSDIMAKGIKGELIYKIKRIDEKSIVVIFKDGRKLKFYAGMCDYDDCELFCEKIYE